MQRKGIITTVTVLLAVLGILALGSCDTSGGSDTGIMELSMTDAPLMEDGVNGVYITVKEVQYNGGDGWVPMQGLELTEPFDLLALQNGNSELLGQLVLPAGNYEQIRFILGAPEEGQPAGNPGSWVEMGSTNDGEYTDGEDTPLFVPSGAQTGYKATAEEPFSVPANGSVAITADFDLRRAVVELGATERFILKPVLRIVVEDQAGVISGEATGETDATYVAYAYEAGSYDSSETDEPADGESRFPNAVTSGEIVDDPDGADYVLPFLAAGEYEIVVAKYDEDGAFQSAEKLETDVITVTSGKTTSVDIDVSGI
ncbi:MAG: DUF4382 domain-containing protein [Alkalispirochaetaceae bacterium]